MALASSTEQYKVRRPNEQNRERLVTDALTANTVPAEQLRVYRAAPRGELFPERYGRPHKPPTIEMVLDTIEPPEWRTWVTGGPADFSGSARASGSGWW